jgi:cleavage and polyadenylation specificity factor subunit 1
MGAVLQQHVENAWQPLAFFFKTLNPAQQKYRAYDRELMAIYEAVKHFRHMLERATSPSSPTTSPSPTP